MPLKFGFDDLIQIECASVFWNSVFFSFPQFLFDRFFTTTLYNSVGNQQCKARTVSTKCAQFVKFVVSVTVFMLFVGCINYTSANNAIFSLHLKKGTI